PIVVRRSGSRPIFLPYENGNPIVLRDVAHLTFKGLEVDGRGMMVNGLAHQRTLCPSRSPGRLAYPCSGAPYQQRVAISSKCPSLGLDGSAQRRFEGGNRPGLYFGNSDGNYPFWRGLIEYNWIADTWDYSLQIPPPQTPDTQHAFPTQPHPHLPQRVRQGVGFL
ncbi:MAG: hypothetical protein N3A60_11840, partial [Thermanaerothrix sp.]|nr:hypothetical protein [Thermanaerothrix sp.]